MIHPAPPCVIATAHTKVASDRTSCSCHTSVRSTAGSATVMHPGAYARAQSRMPPPPPSMPYPRQGR
jgi:hypothetical protein